MIWWPHQKSASCDLRLEHSNKLSSSKRYTGIHRAVPSASNPKVSTTPTAVPTENPKNQGEVMSKNIINRKRKQQQEYPMDSLSSSSSDTENVVNININIHGTNHNSLKVKRVKQKSTTTPSYHGERNGTLQELCEKYGCANTLKCKGCSTIFDGSKRMY